jgi:hypothetical protein
MSGGPSQVAVDLALQPDPALAAAFIAAPSGPHPTELARLVIAMRMRLVRPWIAAVRVDGGFHLVALCGRGHPLKVVTDTVLATSADVERAAFRLRWTLLFGEACPS